MYFICKGILEVCSSDGKTIYKVLYDGDFFGEYALVTSQKRSASVRTVTYCDLFILTRKDFKNVLSNFPDFAKKIDEIKKKYIFETK